MDDNVHIIPKDSSPPVPGSSYTRAHPPARKRHASQDLPGPSDKKQKTVPETPPTTDADSYEELVRKVARLQKELQEIKAETGFTSSYDLTEGRHWPAKMLLVIRAPSEGAGQYDNEDDYGPFIVTDYKMTAKNDTEGPAIANVSESADMRNVLRGLKAMDIGDLKAHWHKVHGPRVCLDRAIRPKSYPQLSVGSNDNPQSILTEVALSPEELNLTAEHICFSLDHLLSFSPITNEPEVFWKSFEVRMSGTGYRLPTECDLDGYEGDPDLGSYRLLEMLHKVASEHGHSLSPDSVEGSGGSTVSLQMLQSLASRLQTHENSVEEALTAKYFASEAERISRQSHASQYPPST